MSTQLLEGKVAIITGAATGMGRATAKLFASEGAKVSITDIKDKEANETVKMIKEAGGEAMFSHIDVAKLDDLQKMVKITVDTYGKLDIFYHNAGIAGPGSIDVTSEADYDLTMAINLKAGFFGAKYAVPELRKAGGGCILFTSSSGGGLKPSLGSPTYSLTKAGLVMLTRTLASHLAADNIRVNCIAPGAVETPLFPSFFTRGADWNFEEVKKTIKERRPMKRFGMPEEIAEAALFLASSKASYITGVTLAVDGGFAAI